VVDLSLGWRLEIKFQALKIMVVVPSPMFTIESVYEMS